MGRERSFQRNLLAGVITLCLGAHQSLAFETASLPPIPSKEQQNGPIVLEPRTQQNAGVTADFSKPTNQKMLIQPEDNVETDSLQDADLPTAPAGKAGSLTKEKILVPIDQAILDSGKIIARLRKQPLLSKQRHYEKVGDSRRAKEVGEELKLEPDDFAGVVVVSQGPVEEPLFEQGYGNLPGTKKLYSPDTQFLLASVTKQFVATLIMKEVNQYNILLNHPITEYLPKKTTQQSQNMKSWEGVTVENLLTHTSGFAEDYFNKEVFETQDDVFNYIATHFRPRSTEIGKVFTYNNTNYFLLGSILEYVNPGRHLSDLVKDEITKPLSMTRSGMLPPWSEKANVLYNPKGEPQAAKPANYFAVGNMISTGQDLFLWQRALFEDSLSQLSLDKEDIALMIKTPLPSTGGALLPANLSITKKDLNVSKTTTEYGFGFHVTKTNGKTIIWHTGHINGHTTLVEHYLDDDITIVVLTNLDKYPVKTIANKVVDAVFKVVPEMPVSAQESRSVRPPLAKRLFLASLKTVHRRAKKKGKKEDSKKPDGHPGKAIAANGQAGAPQGF